MTYLSRDISLKRETVICVPLVFLDYQNRASWVPMAFRVVFGKLAYWLRFRFFLFCFVSKAGSCEVGFSGLVTAVWPRLTSDSWCFSCLSLLGSGIIGLCHLAPVVP